jgi:hypothetical protein
MIGRVVAKGCWAVLGGVCAWAVAVRVVWVNAGLLLFGLSRGSGLLTYLALLATVRGGTSFLFPTAKKKQKQRKRLSTDGSKVSQACSFQLFGTSEKRSTPDSPTLESLPLRIPTSTRFATSVLGQAPKETNRYSQTLPLRGFREDQVS